MSYTINYRAMYIRLSDGSYIPMIETGDNNVWECDNRRRARDWTKASWLIPTAADGKARYSASEQEILDELDKEIRFQVETNKGNVPPFGGEPYTEEHILSNLSYFNALTVSGHRTTSAKQLTAFIKSGFRNAVTIDQVRGGLQLGWYENHNYVTVAVTSEEDLAAKWQECYEKGINGPYIDFNWSAAEQAWKGLALKRKKDRYDKIANGPSYVVSFNYFGSKVMLMKIKKKRFQYCRNTSVARHYTTESAARRAAKTLETRYADVSDARVETYDNRT